MKRVTLGITVLAAMVFATSLFAADGEAAWFDLEGCSMRKHMTAEEGLMEHMHWENHLVSHGMLSLTRVDPG